MVDVPNAACRKHRMSRFYLHHCSKPPYRKPCFDGNFRKSNAQTKMRKSLRTTTPRKGTGWFPPRSVSGCRAFESVSFYVRYRWLKMRRVYSQYRLLQVNPASVPVSTAGCSLRKPKISHHIDGTSHISGNGIVSGYEGNWNPKGLSVKSFDLRGYNDGWPVFACSIRADSLWKFRNIPISEIDTKGSELLKKRHLIIPTSNLPETTNPFYFIVEGYYVHKSHLPDPEIMNESPILYRKHPRYWVIQLCALQSPDSSPYVFWIFVRKEPCPLVKSFILSFWASPWIVRDDGNWDILTLMVSDDELPVERSSLNYTP